MQLEHMLVDAAAMHLIRRPRDFDVIVTENMFGDILTDEASMLAGSLGLLPSASLGDGDAAGCTSRSMARRPTSPAKGSPIRCGTILSVAMLLRHSLRLESEARGVGSGVGRAIESAARAHADIVAVRRARPYRPAMLGDAVLTNALARPSASRSPGFGTAMSGARRSRPAARSARRSSRTFDTH